MNYWWVRIRSWHAVQPSRAIQPRTVCGRIAAIDADRSETLPAGKSCETCLRIIARQEDQ